VLSVSGSGFRCIYFLPGTHDSVGLASNEWYLYKTTDAGETWREIPMPVMSDGHPLYQFLYGINFEDSLTGWMTYGWSPNFGGSLKTTDAGETWSEVQLPQQYGGMYGAIYVDPATKHIFLNTWEAGPYSLESFDNGTTWQWIIGVCGTGFAFSSDTDGLIASQYAGITNGSSFWLGTTNGGQSWNPLSMDSECWQPLALNGSKSSFAITDFSGTVCRTQDNWATWRNTFTFPPVTDRAGVVSSGCIQGDSCLLFTQVTTGCYFSTDQGQSWLSTGGVPTTDVWDRRFWVDNHKVIIGATDTINDSGFSHLWKLNLDSFLWNYGIFARLDNGSQQTALHPGDSVGVTFVPGAGTLAATDSVELTLRYDPNAVSLSTLTLPAGWWVADSSYSNGVLTLVLRSDSAEPLPNPLLHAEFKTYLTPSESHAGSTGPRAFIYLDNAQSFFPQTTPCAPTTLSLQSPDSVEIDFTGCGDSTILAAMQGQPPFSIVSIVPNPARTSLTIRVDAAVFGGIAYELFDALGRSRRSGEISGESASLDVTSLAAGCYYLRLSSNGYVQSRSIAIER